MVLPNVLINIKPKSLLSCLEQNMIPNFSKGKSAGLNHRVYALILLPSQERFKLKNIGCTKALFGRTRKLFCIYCNQDFLISLFTAECKIVFSIIIATPYANKTFEQPL